MPGAVFLSYASQDAEAARRICEALRSGGVEVWFDQEGGLEHGDEWDAKIRQQIKECVLFVPLISANTQSRHEGYFRIEWDLAAERAQGIASGVPFILPVVIDDTREPDALVPDRFRKVQWTRLPDGVASPEVLARMLKLWSHRTGVLSHEAQRIGGAPEVAIQVLTKRSPWPRLAFAAMAVAALVAAYFALRPGRRQKDAALHLENGQTAGSTEATTQPAPVAASPMAPLVATDARQLLARARGLFDNIDETRESYKIAEDLLRQAVAKDSTDAEVWAAYAQLQARYGIRGWDLSAERLEEARTATERALRLDPRSYEARVAAIYLPLASLREAGEREAATRKLLNERPDDQRVLRSLGDLLRRFPERHDEANQIFDRSAQLPGGDVLALYDKAMNLWFDGRATEAEAALRAALVQKPFLGARLMEINFALRLRGDLNRANALLDTIPASALLEDRGCFIAYEVYRYSNRPDAALSAVRGLSRDWINDASFFRGPRGLLVGDALAQSGRLEAAAVEWQAALKLVDARLAVNPKDDPALNNRLILLALLGETVEARRLLTALLQLRGLDRPGVLHARGEIVRACMQLGERAEALRLIEAALKSKLHAVFVTAADLRYDPIFSPLRSEPEFTRLIAEADSIEKADDAAATPTKP